MNRYDPRTPRAYSGLAAVALCALTLAVSVLAPVTLASAPVETDLSTRVESERCVPTDDSIVTAIDVVAARTPRPGAIAQSRDASPGQVRDRG